MEANMGKAKDSKGKEKVDESQPEALKPKNWMEEGVLNEVRDQKKCDCCWAIVSSASMEALHNIRHRSEKKLQLAPQELVNCVDSSEKKCYTKSVNEGFRFAQQYGIKMEKDCPFVAKKQCCTNKIKSKEGIKLIGFTKIDDGNEGEIMKVLNNQPVCAALTITEDFRHHKEGIYEGPQGPPSGKKLVHAVLIVGWGIDEVTGQEFWWIQNSWGTKWGINGYAKVRRASEGKKSLFSRASYPTEVEYFVSPKEEEIKYVSSKTK